MKVGSRGALAAFVIVAALAASGCQLLAAAGMPGASELPIGGTSGGVAGAVGEPGADPSLPAVGDAAPRPIASYHNGRATIQSGCRSIAIRGKSRCPNGIPRTAASAVDDVSPG